MKLKELEAEVKALRNEVQTLKDIEEIKTLQRAYGYYIEHYMTKEVGDCFADDPDVAVHLVGSGSYIGKKGIADWLSTDPKHMEPLFQHAIGSTRILSRRNTASVLLYTLIPMVKPLSAGGTDTVK